MGDWNAKVGKDHETWGPTIGKFGYDEMNDRGEHREIVPPRETVAIARVAIAIMGRGG